MAKHQFVKGETSVILIGFIQNNSLTTGLGLGSLDQTSSITGGYVKRNGTGVALAVDENVTTEGTYEAPTTAAQVRIGTVANLPTGHYEFHFHNDLFTTADYVVIGLGGAVNMAPLEFEIQLTSLNLNDGVRGALTALPNAVVDGAGGLPISDAGGLDLDAMNTNINDIETSTDAILVDTTEIGAAGAGLTDLGGMSTAMKAEVNAEAKDVLDTDTHIEPSQGTPGATISTGAKIDWLYKNWRNRKTQTATQWNLMNDDATTIDHKSTLSDDGTTFDKTEIVTGP